MSFRTRLVSACAARASHLCVGIDPHPAQLELPLEEQVRIVLDAAAPYAVAVKLNLAFFEALGRDGWRALDRALALVPDGMLRIADAKRGDVPHTAERYAEALFAVWGFDAATVNPYPGLDGVEAFLQHRGRGAFVLSRTSNPGAALLQDVEVVGADGQEPVYLRIARLVAGMERCEDAGLVVGATAPEQLARVREVAAELPILVPGVGSQGGDARAAVAAAGRGGAPYLVNVSRGIFSPAGEGPLHARAEEAAHRFHASVEPAT